MCYLLTFEHVTQHTYHQQCRIEHYRKFKEFKARIMVATNLFGRGIDVERVNVVVNYDMPENADTYLHRVRNFSPLFASVLLPSLPFPFYAYS